MTTIICTKCGDLTELTQTSVTLPFVCKDCQEASDFQNLIAPRNPPEFQKALDTLIGFGGWTKDELVNEPPTPELDHTTATVENTTLLIADLEEQVKMGDEALATANELVNDLKKQLTESQLDGVRKNGVINNLQVDKVLLQGKVLDNEAELKEWEKTAKSSMIAFDILEAHIATQKGVIAREAQRRRELFHENIGLRARGFWARVFNSDVN